LLNVKLLVHHVTSRLLKVNSPCFHTINNYYANAHKYYVYTYGALKLVFQLILLDFVTFCSVRTVADSEIGRAGYCLMLCLGSWFYSVRHHCYCAWNKINILKEVHNLKYIYICIIILKSHLFL